MAPSAAHPAPVARLARWVKADRNDLLLVLLYAVASSVVALSVPVTVQAMVNTVAFGAVIQPVVVLSLLVFVALTAAAAFRALQARVVETIQERLFARTALTFGRSFPRVDASVLDQAHGPELANRFFDVLTLQKSAATLLVDGSALALQTIVGMVVLAFYHPYLLAFDALLVAAMAFVFFGLGRGAERTAIAESKAKYAMAAWLQELLRHPLLFKDPGGHELAARRTHELTRAYLGARRSHFDVLFRQIVGALGFQVVFASLLIATGGLLVLQKQLTLGQLVAAEIIVSGVLASFSKVGKQLESLYDMLAAFDKLGHLDDLPEESGGRGALPRRAGAPASLSVKDVSFTYGGRRILERASLEVRAGERVALVGPNGSGKSTLMNLFYGLRRVEGGVLEVDGETVHTLAPDALRGSVAMVRGMEIFEGSVLDNVVAGRDDVTADDARAALERVELWDDVKTWPAGLDTRLNPHAPKLSLGQARKLVIARAVAARPRLLLLDESLDDLDVASRDTVTRYLLSPERPWTVLLTTHDATMLSHCTRVVTLDDGRFVEGGAPPPERLP